MVCNASMIRINEQISIREKRIAIRSTHTLDRLRTREKETYFPSLFSILDSISLRSRIDKSSSS